MKKNKEKNDRPSSSATNSPEIPKWETDLPITDFLSIDELTSRGVAERLKKYLSLFDSLFLHGDLILKGPNFKRALVDMIEILEGNKNQSSLSLESGLLAEEKFHLSLLNQAKVILTGLEYIDASHFLEQSELINRLLELFPEEEDLSLLNQLWIPVQFLGCLVKGVNVLPQTMEELRVAITFPKEDFAELIEGLQQDTTQKMRLASTTLWLYHTQIYEGLCLQSTNEVIDADMIIRQINALVSTKKVRLLTVEEIIQILVHSQPTKDGEDFLYKFNTPFSAHGFAFALKAAFRQRNYEALALSARTSGDNSFLRVDANSIRKLDSEDLARAAMISGGQAAMQMDLDAKVEIPAAAPAAAKSKKVKKNKGQSKGLAGPFPAVTSSGDLIDDKKAASVKAMPAKEIESAEANVLRAALTVLGISQPERMVRVKQPKKALSLHYLIEREQEAKDSLEMLRAFFKVFKVGGLGKTAVIGDSNPGPEQQVYSCSYLLTHDHQKRILEIASRADKLQQTLQDCGMVSVKKVSIIINGKSKNEPYYQLYFADQSTAEKEFKGINEKLGSKRAIQVQQDAQGFYFLLKEDQGHALIERLRQRQQGGAELAAIAGPGPGPASMPAVSGLVVQPPAQPASSAVSRPAAVVVTPGSPYRAAPAAAPRPELAPAAALFHGPARERKHEVKFVPKSSPRNYAGLFGTPISTLGGAPGGPPLQPLPPNSPEDRQSNQDDNNHPSGPAGAAPQPARSRV